MFAKTQFFATAVLCMLITTDSLAWNARGHKVVAEIAWQKLDAASRAAVVATLRHHPRFDTDFADRLQAELGRVSTDVADHWIFCQAATWPDIARGSSFDRPRWHYINLPVFLNAQQAAHFAGNLPANVSFEYPSQLAKTKLNGVQAVKQSLEILTSSDADTDDRALHYCWLLHVVGDLHQPLHTSALFTERLFPGGDQGGNKVMLRRQRSSADPRKLHSIWDSILGNKVSFNDVLDKAQRLISDHPSEFNMPFVALPNDVWTTEGQQLALEYGYGPIMDELRDAEAAPGGLGAIEVPESYFSHAGQLASRQAVIAGVRLAALLKAILNTPPAPSALAAPPRDYGFPVAIARNIDRAPVAGTHRSLGQSDAEPALIERIAHLEHEVRALHVQLQMRIDERVRALPGLVQQADLATDADDGAQCDCGDEQ